MEARFTHWPKGVCTLLPLSPPAEDCEWSSWSEWSLCSATCGTGRQSSTRVILQSSQYGGAPCEGPDHRTTSCMAPDCGEWEEGKLFIITNRLYRWYIWYMITIFSADLKLLTGIFVLAIMQRPSSGTAAWLVEAYNHNTVILPKKTFSPTNYVITTTGVITRGGRRNMNPHLRKDMCAPPKISPETQPCYLNDINKPSKWRMRKVG